LPGIERVDLSALPAVVGGLEPGGTFGTVRERFDTAR